MSGSWGGGITCFDLTHLIQKFIKSSSKSYDTSLKYIGHLYNLRKVGPLDIISEHQDKRKGHSKFSQPLQIMKVAGLHFMKT